MKLWLFFRSVTSGWIGDRKSTRLNSSHGYTSYAVFCLKKKNALAVVLAVLREQDERRGVRRLERQDEGQQGVVQRARVELQVPRRERVPGQPEQHEAGH